MLLFEMFPLYFAVLDVFLIKFDSHYFLIEEIAADGSITQAGW